jgi:hypothetical protein
MSSFAFLLDLNVVLLKCQGEEKELIACWIDFFKRLFWSLVVLGEGIRQQIENNVWETVFFF